MKAPSNAALVERLAEWSIARHPGIYAGHHEDARTYWKNQCPTKYDLLLSCSAHGLLSRDEEYFLGVAHGRSIARARRRRK